MPKNASKTGKSSKTARVLSLLTDPAASLLGGSRNHKEEDDATELMEDAPQSAAPGLDDAATESRIHDTLAAQEDELMGLFGQRDASRARPRREPPAQPAPSAPQEETSRPVPPKEEASAPEPDPRTMELLSLLSNPSTLGNSAMPPEDISRPSALDMDFSDLTEGLESPLPRPVEEPAPEPEPPTPQPAPQAAPQPAQQPAPQPMRQPTPQAQQPAQQSYAQPAPQAAQQPYAQPAPQAAQQSYAQPAPQAAQQPYAQPAPQAAQQPYAQPAPQAAQQPAPQSYAPQPAASPAAHELKKKQEEFVCFNLTQALVEDKADKLMKQFGMCTCNRCRVDVTALALSNLPAKYVAMQNRDILPLLSMHEEKYSAAVTVQVMSACRKVMQRPHHGR